MKGKLVSLASVLICVAYLLPAQPSLTILSPKADVRWSRGGTYAVRWAATAVDSIRIEYSTTGTNGPWTLLVSGIPSSSNSMRIQGEHEIDKFTRTGSYYWTIPYSPSDSCYIRVSQKSNLAVSDKKRFVIAYAGVWSVQVSDVDLPLYTVQANGSVWGGAVGWAGGKNGLILKTVDSGTRWEAVSMVEGDVRAITAADPNTAIVGTVQTSGAARIYRTTNGGGSWSIVDSTNTVWRHIRLFNEIFSDRVGFALGDPVAGFWVMKRTTDRGRTWSEVLPRVPASAGEECRYGAMVWSDSLHGWFGTNANRVYRTTNGGATWTSVMVQLGTSNITAVYFNSNLYGLVGTSNGSISRTTDGGASWSAGASSLPTTVLGISGLNYTLQCWAVSGTNVYSSQDSGKTWSATTYEGYEGSVPLNHLSLSGSYGSGIGWAVGDDGTIIGFKRVITDVSRGVSELPNAYVLYQNYPNPFNPTTTIKYQIPEVRGQRSDVSVLS